MKVAILSKEGQVAAKFADADECVIYNVRQMIGNYYPVDVSEMDVSGTIGTLQQEKVQVLICGGISSVAREALDQAGIRYYARVRGEADVQLISQMMMGALNYNNDFEE